MLASLGAMQSGGNHSSKVVTHIYRYPISVWAALQWQPWQQVDHLAKRLAAKSFISNRCFTAFTSL